MFVEGGEEESSLGYHHPAYHSPGRRLPRPRTSGGSDVDVYESESERKGVVATKGGGKKAKRKRESGEGEGASGSGTAAGAGSGGGEKEEQSTSEPSTKKKIPVACNFCRCESFFFSYFFPFIWCPRKRDVVQHTLRSVPSDLDTHGRPAGRRIHVKMYRVRARIAVWRGARHLRHLRFFNLVLLNVLFLYFGTRPPHLIIHGRQSN